MEKVVVKSVGEALDFLADLPGEWAFRGQSSPWELKPTLYRSELRSPETPAEHEARVIDAFVQRASVYGADPALFDPSRWFDLLALMQHHGAPTRLLDWTSSAAIALRFAYRRVGQKTDSSPVVFAADMTAINSATDGKALEQYAPRREDWPMGPRFVTKHVATHPRMVHQGGVFLLFGRIPEPRANLPAKSLIQVTLSAPPENVWNKLGRSGITETMLFPDLDGLGRELAFSTVESPAKLIPQ